MLLKEIVTVYFEKHIRHINTLRGKSVQFLNIAACGTLINYYTNHCTYKGPR